MDSDKVYEAFDDLEVRISAIFNIMEHFCLTFDIAKLKKTFLYNFEINCYSESKDIFIKLTNQLETFYDQFHSIAKQDSLQIKNRLDTILQIKNSVNTSLQNRCHQKNNPKTIYFPGSTDQNILKIENDSLKLLIREMQIQMGKNSNSDGKNYQMQQNSSFTQSNSLTREINELKNKNKILEFSNKTFSAQIQKIEKEKSLLISKNKELTSQNENLSEQYIKLNIEMRHLYELNEENKDFFDKTSKEFKSHTDELINKNSEKQQTIDPLNDEIDNLKIQINQKDEKIFIFEKQQQEINALKYENEGLKKQFSEQQQEIQKLTNENDQLKIKNSELTDNNQKLTEDLVSQLNESDSLHDSLNKSHSKILNLSDNCKSQEDSISNLNEKLEEFEKENQNLKIIIKKQMILAKQENELQIRKMRKIQNEEIESIIGVIAGQL